MTKSTPSPLITKLEPLPTAYQWGELADRYEEMAHAYDAFEWWNRNWTNLTVQEVQPLAEAVAAIQQRFNRLLFRIGARDPYQQILFDDLRTWAREAQCYLHSLRPKVPIAELIERASTMISAWEGAKIPVAEAQERNRLLNDVERMISEDTFGANGEIDELRLHNLLLECREAKVSPSDKRLRDALLPWSAFLEGEDRFRDILRDVNLEWERRQDAERPEDYEPEPPEALLPLQNELEALREITRGKRFLLLGGTPREDVKQKIAELFEFASIEWLRTRPDSTSADFVSAMENADAVGLFTRFSRKEWKHVENSVGRMGASSGGSVAAITRPTSSRVFIGTRSPARDGRGLKCKGFVWRRNGDESERSFKEEFGDFGLVITFRETESRLAFFGSERFVRALCQQQAHVFESPYRAENISGVQPYWSSSLGCAG